MILPNAQDDQFETETVQFSDISVRLLQHNLAVNRPEIQMNIIRWCESKIIISKYHQINKLIFQRQLSHLIGQSEACPTSIASTKSAYPFWTVLGSEV